MGVWADGEGMDEDLLLSLVLASKRVPPRGETGSMKLWPEGME